MLYNIRLDGGKLITSVYYDAGKAPQVGDILNLAEPPPIGSLYENNVPAEAPKRAYRVTKITEGLATGSADSFAPPEPTLVVELV